MAVEIVILSGSRQGQQWIFEGEQFRVGDEPACEVYFNPALDPGARGRLVLFRHHDDGWNVLPLGTPGLLLDYEPLADPRTIRSGQVLRMSADGPDCSFRVLTAAEARQAVAEARRPVVPTVPATLPADLPPAIPASSLAVLSAAGVGPAIPPPPVPAKPKVNVARLALLSAAAVVAALLIVGVVVKAAFQPAGNDLAPLIDTPRSPPSTAAPEPPAAPTPVVEEKRERLPAPAAQAVDFAAALEPVRKAIYLLEVEQTMPDGSATAWPFAACCAISDHALLTTGNVGCELLRFRFKKFKVYAARPADQVKLLVGEIRVRADYFDHQEDRPRQRYCDLALLSVEGPLPSFVPIASREALGKIEEGLRLGLLGYPHDGTKITPHDSFKLDFFEGKVFVIRALEPQTAGTPLCLDLVTSLPANAYGFAVFTAEGRLAGVYNEPASEEESRGMKNLHFVTAVDPAFIERGLRERNERLWVEPKVTDGAPPERKP
jgi:hypothetical protein